MLQMYHASLKTIGAILTLYNSVANNHKLIHIHEHSLIHVVTSQPASLSPNLKLVLISHNVLEQPSVFEL